MSQLSNVEIGALNDALDDEYKALATYDQVIEEFGAIRPFINIRESESRHISALHQLFNEFGLTPPPNTWADKAPRYDSVELACAASVQGEIDNVALYDRIIGNTENARLLTVFHNLHDASQRRHLPAFQRCLRRDRHRKRAR